MCCWLVPSDDRYLQWLAGIAIPVSLISIGVWMYGKQLPAAVLKRVGASCVVRGAGVGCAVRAWGAQCSWRGSGAQGRPGGLLAVASAQYHVWPRLLRVAVRP